MPMKNDVWKDFIKSLAEPEPEPEPEPDNDSILYNDSNRLNGRQLTSLSGARSQRF